MSLNLARQDAMDYSVDDHWNICWETYDLYTWLSELAGKVSPIDTIRVYNLNIQERVMDHNKAVKHINDALDLIRGHYEGE